MESTICSFRTRRHAVVPEPGELLINEGRASIFGKRKGFPPGKAGAQNMLLPLEESSRCLSGLCLVRGTTAESEALREQISSLA